MRSSVLFLATCTGLLGVAAGAFGAHGLKSILSPEMLSAYKTGVMYQMWHALGLGLIAILQEKSPLSALLNWSGWLMFAGIILFSGSLYLLAITGTRWLGMITPFGGLAFMFAWLLIACYAFQKPLDPNL